MGVRGALGVGLLAFGCGLDLAGTLPTPDADAGVTTGAVPAPMAPPPGPPVPCTSSSSTCTQALDAGWTPVALAKSASAACPSNFQASEIVSSPSAPDGACSCGCTIDAADPPNCAKGSFTGVIGSSTCDTPSQTFTFSSTACTAVGSTLSLSAVAKLTPVAAHNGSCIVNAPGDPSKVTTQPGRLCAPSAACAEDVCNGTAPSGFAACIQHDGDVACPMGPFTKTLVGASATVSCSGCSCQASAICGAATMRYYNDSKCATEVGARPVDGNCDSLSSGSTGATATYFRYDVSTIAACVGAGTPTATPGLDQPRTICCR